MTSPKNKILKMVADGKIGPEDGEELMGAMGQKTKFTWRSLINPFDRMPDMPGLLVSLLLAVLSAVVSVLLKVRFDGVLDVHAASSPVSAAQAIFDQGIVWIGFALVLWATSLIFARQGRFIDFLITVGIARFAVLPLGVITGVLFPDPDVLMRIVTSTPYHPVVLLMALAGIVFMIWFVTWLFQGFKTASGLAKGRLVVAFVVAIIAAEALSKLALFAMPAAIGDSRKTDVQPAAPYDLPGETEKERARAFFELLEDGRFEKAWSSFNGEMAQALSVNRLEWTYRSIKWEMGDLVRIEDVRQAPKDGFTVVDLVCKFQNKRGVVRVVFDKNDRVSGLWFKPPKSALPKTEGADLKPGESVGG